MTFGEIRYREASDKNGGKRGWWGINASADVMMRLKRLLPSADHTRSGWIALTDTTTNARDLAWIRQRWTFTITAEDEERLERGAEESRIAEEVLTEILAGGHRELPPGSIEPMRAPRDYQETAAALAGATGRLLLADELGLGKSMSAIMLLAKPSALPALIVCPTNLPPQWVRETLATFPMLRPHIIKRMKVYDPAATRSMKGHPPDVLITGYHKLAAWGDHLAGKVKTVIFDECQELRRDESAKYKAARTVAARADYRLGLSATPIYNYGGEIWNILDVLAPDALGTRNEFARTWCGTDRWAEKIRVKDPAALGTHLYSTGLMLRRTRKDVGRELPEVMPISHPIDSDSRTYDSLTSDAAALARVITSAATSTQEKFAARGELDNQIRHATGVAKAPFVADFVRMLLESGEPVVLFGWHRDVYDIWQERLKDLLPAMYTGSESSARKEANAQRFLAGAGAHTHYRGEKFPGTDLLVMSLRSGAGLDGLQARCKVAVFGELDWSPGMHGQCLDADTEVLTRRGFLGVDDLLPDDKVAAFDHESGAIRWRPIQRKIDRPLATHEEMYALTSPGVDLRVTGGHRMVHRHTEGKARTMTGWHFEHAETLARRSQGWALPVAGQEKALGVPLTDHELSFLGWWITDGGLNERVREANIHQALASPFNDHIVATLNGCGFAWSVNRTEAKATRYKRNSPMLRYRIPKFYSRTRDGRGWDQLRPYLDKDFSPLLDAMTARQLAVFMEAVHMGDGHKQTGQDWTQRSYHIGISRKPFADRLQSLLLRRGWRANLAERPTPTGRPHWTLRCKPEPVRTVGGHGKPSLGRAEATPRERVWCVSNDLSTLVVRRNGKTAIVGNCVGRLHRDGQAEPVVAYYLVSTQGSDPPMSEVLEAKRQQSEPIKDPNAELLTDVVSTEGHVERLAADFLQRAAA